MIFKILKNDIFKHKTTMNSGNRQIYRVRISAGVGSCVILSGDMVVIDNPKPAKAYKASSYITVTSDSVVKKGCTTEEKLIRKLFVSGPDSGIGVL